jgi:D-serine deaminase-like pyridoxal phosphate-dependent protein
MKELIKLVVGTSWKSSLSGLLIAISIAVVAYAQARPEPVWYVVAVGFAALGRMAKDWDKSNSPAPTPEATKVVAP